MVPAAVSVSPSLSTTVRLHASVPAAVGAPSEAPSFRSNACPLSVSTRDATPTSSASGSVVTGAETPSWLFPWMKLPKCAFAPVASEKTTVPICGARPLVGATVELFVKLESQSLPCGVFIVTSVQAEERSGRIRLSGEDSIASELAAAFDDGLTYPATLASLWGHLVAQTRYVWSGTLPNGSAVIDAKPDWDGASLRRAAGWIAQAAGCFVRIGRAGDHRLKPPAQGRPRGRISSFGNSGGHIRPEVPVMRLH